MAQTWDRVLRVQTEDRALVQTEVDGSQDQALSIAHPTLHWECRFSIVTTAWFSYTLLASRDKIKPLFFLKFGSVANVMINSWR